MCSLNPVCRIATPLHFAEHGLHSSNYASTCKCSLFRVLLRVNLTWAFATLQIGRIREFVAM